MWSSAERYVLNEYISDLLNTESPQLRIPRGQIELSLQDCDHLLDNLRCSIRGILIRRMLELLGCDESYPFKWRLDSKLIQAILVNEFSRDTYPSTVGLGTILQETDEKRVRAYLQSRFPEGFIIKTNYGCSSSGASILPRTESVIGKIETGEITIPFSPHPRDEEFVVQQRVIVKKEYKVYTFGKNAVPALTFPNNEETGRKQLSRIEIETVNSFVMSVLDSLPDAMTEQSLCGWDVALDTKDNFHIIEINYAGNHPFYKSGFQCGGQFQHPDWSAYYVAQLFMFLETFYNCEFHIDPIHSNREISDMLYWVNNWKHLIAVSRDIKALSDASRECMGVDDMSVRELIFMNKANAMHRKYLEYLTWLSKITDDLRVGLISINEIRGE